MEIHKLKIEFTVIIMFHLTAIVKSEEFEIFRTKAPGFYGDRHGTDSFKIPPSLCNQGGMKCEQFGAKTEQPCFCSCPYDNATFLFDNNEWRCLDNAYARRLLAYNSSNYILFKNETVDNPLRLVKVGDHKRITTHTWYEPWLDLRNSWHIGCNGSAPFDNNFTNVFKILQDFSLHYPIPLRPYFLWVNNTAATQLEGQIIKLRLNSGGFTNLWLLFKYVGNLKCLAPTLAPTLPPIVTTKPLNSTVKPSPSEGTVAAGNSVKASILLSGCHAFLFMLLLGI